jgi:hypothetical protein
MRSSTSSTAARERRFTTGLLQEIKKVDRFRRIAIVIPDLPEEKADEPSILHCRLESARAEHPPRIVGQFEDRARWHGIAMKYKLFDSHPTLTIRETLTARIFLVEEVIAWTRIA